MDRLEKARMAQEKYKKSKIDVIENNLNLPGIKKARFYYPFTTFLLKVITKMENSKISYLHERDVLTPSDRPVIFANTHRFKPDLEKISLSTKKPSFVVASDFVNSYKTINGWYFNTRPTIFVDPYSKEDKKYTYDTMIRYLKSGLDCMIFPEAVWNLSENKIVLDTFFGTVRAALETNAVIVCTAIERYDNEFVINRNGYIDLLPILKKYTDLSFAELDQTEAGKELQKEIVKECNIVLRDTMATLLFEIWSDYAERNGITKRKDISDTYWKEKLEFLTGEWKGYKMQDNVEQQYQNKRDIEYRDVQKDLDKIRSNPNDKNLFMNIPDDRYTQYLETIDNLNSRKK